MDEGSRVGLLGKGFDVDADRPLVPLAQAKELLLDGVAPLARESVTLDEALGRFLAQDLRAPFDLPRFDNSAMDGYALRAEDVPGPGTLLAVVGFLPAGSKPTARLEPKQAMRIMTGAPIPEGANCVVMLEDTQRAANEDQVVVSKVPVVGQHIRCKGEDVKAGQSVLPAGTRMDPAAIALAASLGMFSLQLHKRPVVGVMTTGDELLVSQPRDPSLAGLSEGMLYDSNRPMLLAAARANGGIPLDLGCVPDELASIEKSLLSAAESCDLILTTGGASIGDRDWAKELLPKIATGEHRWLEVAIKPAKPLAYCWIGKCLLLCLPGNPVSALVGFELFAREAIQKFLGNPRPEPPKWRATLTEDVRHKKDGKLHLLLSIVERDEGGRLTAKPAGAQASHLIAMAARANAIAFLSRGSGPIEGISARNESQGESQGQGEHQTVTFPSASEVELQMLSCP
jgi:molybdopterin molybdotransferase